VESQDLLVEIAENDTHPWVRREALKRIADRDVRERIESELDAKDIAEASENEYYRKVTDYSLSEFERQEYVDEIRDEKILRMLAQDRSLYELRISVIEKITNQEFLKELYHKTPEGHIRRVIVNKIEDKEFLRFVYNNDPDISISKQAFTLLGEDF
jgi:hypothetical protein